MRQLLGLGLSLLVSSCASEYTCKEYPTGSCQSVAEVYAQTKNKTYEIGGTNKKAEDVFSDNIHKSHDYSFPETVGPESNVKNFDKEPRLKDPRVMRVLLNKWEDEDHDLNMGGYIYVKVKDAEWDLP